MTDKTSVQEQQLLAKIKGGDLVAVKKWYQAYLPELKKYILLKISNHQDAEEIIQDTFINCLKHLAVFNGRSSIKTWMVSIAKHEVADYYRKKYAKKIIKTLPLNELVLSEALSDASQVSVKVGIALDKMRVDYQELLLQKYVDGKKVKAIAQELGRSFKSVEADLFRARKDFKELYAATDTS